jgi:hypothetical protein
MLPLSPTLTGKQGKSKDPNPIQQAPCALPSSSPLPSDTAGDGGGEAEEEAEEEEEEEEETHCQRLQGTCWQHRASHSRRLLEAKRIRPPHSCPSKLSENLHL